MVVLNTATAAAHTRAGAAAAPEKSIARTSHGVSLMEGTGYNTNAPRACRYGGCYGWGFAVDTNYATGKTDGPGPPRHEGRPPFCTAIPLPIYGFSIQTRIGEALKMIGGPRTGPRGGDLSTRNTAYLGIAGFGNALLLTGARGKYLESHTTLRATLHVIRYTSKRKGTGDRAQATRSTSTSGAACSTTSAHRRCAPGGEVIFTHPCISST